MSDIRAVPNELWGEVLTAYDSGDVHSASLGNVFWIGYDAGFRAAKQAPAVVESMSRLDALKAAKQFIDEMEVAPVNARGYTVDDWKAADLGSRMHHVQNVARYLLGEDVS